MIELWNWCADGLGASKIYPMDEIEDVLMTEMHMNLLDIIGAVDDKFDTYDHFFSIDSMDYIVSYSELDQVGCPFDINALVDYIIETGDADGDVQIEDALGSAGIGL